LLLDELLPPNARDRRALLATAELADDAGLDTIGFQDHPYQARFLDAWNLLSDLAGRTQHVRLFPNVANIPLNRRLERNLRPRGTALETRAVALSTA
jgi:alkanesulfonate monooxygenase SsuD/methylene tetrahydromethanopterin reductase-like flavin-dependent oxidoreductase (luciferase family)